MCLSNESVFVVVFVAVEAVVVVVGGDPGNVGRVVLDKWFALCWHQRGMLTAHNPEWFDTLATQFLSGPIHWQPDTPTRDSHILGRLDTIQWIQETVDPVQIS